ncbi:hypothetical protein ACQGFJ_19275 [Rhodococcus sp. 3.70]
MIGSKGQGDCSAVVGPNDAIGGSAGHHRSKLRVRLTVGRGPERRELVAGDQRLSRLPNKFLGLSRHHLRKPVQPLRQFLGQPINDSRLDSRFGSQRGNRLDVTVGVVHLGVDEQREHRAGSTETSENDQQ